MINWKLRLKNPVTLAALVTMIVSIVYKLLNLCGVIPSIPAQEFVDLGNLVIDCLALIGIVNDPTTNGLSDSAQAMAYEVPKKG